MSAAKDEQLLADSQARTVEEYDVYLNKDLFDTSKGELDTFVKEAPRDAEGFKVIEGEKAIKVSTLHPDTKHYNAQAGFYRTLD